jgi:DNA-binding winged helix-turn-helix (wHTH) protein/TolB-like protein/tetratricopeptide (TPR) repeat protein
MGTRLSYEFAAFRLDPAERRLLRDGEPVALTPKAFDLLVVLVENGGHLLSKEDLLARVWPDQFVEEGNLSFNISELRKALGEGADGRRYIETVRKKGFRFVASVEEIREAEASPAVQGEVPASSAQTVVEAGPRPAERSADAIALGLSDRSETPARRSPSWRVLTVVLAAGALGLVAYGVWQMRAVQPAERPPKTIAVLPFKPIVAADRDEALEMGMCHALIVRLSGLDQLTVRPTSAVAPYNTLGQDPLAAGRALGVDALLDGYIQRSGDRIRVTAQLLRTSDGKPLWSGQFNEKFTDIFAVQDSISMQMTEALRLNLADEDQRRVTRHSTENVEAYELYLKGCNLQDKRTPEGVKKSVQYFQQAIEKDPNYALAHAGLAESYVILAVRADLPPRDTHRLATAAAERAVALDDASAEAHTALAHVRFWCNWDWPGAEIEFNRAIDLSRNQPIATQYYAPYLMAMGRSREAVAEIERVQRLAPLSLSTNAQAARIYFFAREYDKAIEQCQKTLDMDPDYGGARLFLGRTYTQKGLYREALIELERSRELFGGSAEVSAVIGYTYAAAGRRPEARRVLRELVELSKRRYISPYHMAMIHAGLGEKDEALDLLEQAYEDREGRMTILRVAPEFDGLRSDSRLATLLQRMRLM